MLADRAAATRRECALLGLELRRFLRAPPKGEEAITGETWRLDAIDPLEYSSIHVHQMVRARMGDREGVGTLETICFGRHAPSGFRTFFDGAP